MLAVPVAVVIGLITAEPAGSTYAPEISRSALQQADVVATGPGPTEPGSIEALVRAEDVAVRILADHDPRDVPMSGLAAGLCTLGGCWTLLAGAGAVWRRRLHGRDLDAWAEGWARVEPPWSNRRR